VNTVDRATALQVLHRHLRDELVVAGLGNPAYDLFNAGDRPEQFYLWGGMGLAPSVGLGVALAAPTATVVAMEGDGGVLMNLGALATIGAVQPRNLVLIVWDNRAFDLTGGQPTATAANTDLVAVARGCGLAQTEQVSTLEEFEAVLPAALGTPGPWCLVVDTAPTPPDRKKPVIALRRRFLQFEPFVDAALAKATVR
jgi:thiamine pyrophosphate-dependent acetolactate synthase large subunit-like protein